MSWLCPLVTNTHDPALLRYTILYHLGSTFSDQASMMQDISPVLLTGEESETCLVEAIQPVDEMGMYVVKVVAMAPGMPGDVSDAFAVAATYGTGECVSALCC